MRLCYVTTTDLIVRFFLMEHIRRAAVAHHVTVVANTREPDMLDRAGVNARLVPLGIMRDIAPWSDLKTLFRLYRLFRQERFDLVHSIAPKAGLLAMLAAWLARVPIRIHTYQGEVWATRRGLLRQLLKTIDRLVASLSTAQLVVSHGEREYLIQQGVLREESSRVLVNGSICGVDLERFRPDKAARSRLREELGVPTDAVVFIYLGRLTRDKGVLDLAIAFNAMAGNFPSAWLLFVGPDEQNLVPRLRQLTSSCSDRTRIVGAYTAVPEQYMASADVLCLPSYREGFGLVTVEAAAAGIPSIASRIYGITDAVEDEKTGLLFSKGNWQELAARMEEMVRNPARRRDLGAAARRRAHNLFGQKKVVDAHIEFYENARQCAKS